MKKLLLLFCVSFFAFGSVLANDSDLFSYDKAKVQQAVSDLSQVEKMLNQNPDLSVDELVAQGDLNSSFDATSNSPFSISGEPPLGIPSFLWGCVFWVAGLAIVYFVTEDSSETKKALWGCIAGSLFWIVFPWLVWGSLFFTA